MRDLPTTQRSHCSARARKIKDPVLSATFASTILTSVPSTTVASRTFTFKFKLAESGFNELTLTNFGLRSLIFGGGLAQRASMPGSTLPSKSSKEAPPPVLQCVTSSSVSYFLQQ